ncbi:hypothetical protein SUGI_0410370 [Cryptomeria japonica]|uniref:cyclin-dependent protein kinase inhibitor SMR13 n=1 Tax=Cryptomeria japonica TaxID=3369 RepID=UPI002408C86B|nr:cyclin-dependent protein kinase inhibitor SMR13 [Cryptomeria japonica]GLJ21925.1 hypothetical protein SUGI_0410370 [Cryptomeria japonica]
MAPNSSSTTEQQPIVCKTAGQKRARNEVVFSLPAVRPIVTVRLSEVESSNPGGDSDEQSGNNGVEEECTTPKAKENRIAELLTCPPAPRKRRITCRHRVVLPFFTSPDLDSFFLPLYKMCKQ